MSLISPTPLMQPLASICADSITGEVAATAVSNPKERPTKFRSLSIVFGMPTTDTVLAVFNATTAFEISPLGLMAINAVSLLLDIIFFVILALMISILCKNYAASISTVLVVIILNYALNVVFGGTFWYSVLPGMNLHLFKYFGNAFTSVGDGMILQSILITTIESSMTFIFSILANISYVVIALAIAYSVFKKRDF